MNNFKLKSQAVFAFVLLAMSMFAFGDDNRLDGNWWISQQKNDRLFYAVGFFDGIRFGHNFSLWNVPNGTKTEQGVVKQFDQAYQEYFQKYLVNVTGYQLVNGLDNFYSNYRNRRIKVNGAVWLVLNGIAGTPEDKLNKLIESWRENSTD
jgi:hypothetical protein